VVLRQGGLSECDACSGAGPAVLLWYVKFSTIERRRDAALVVNGVVYQAMLVGKSRGSGARLWMRYLDKASSRGN
jgi:hypothetical protein